MFAHDNIQIDPVSSPENVSFYLIYFVRNHEFHGFHLRTSAIIYNNLMLMKWISSNSPVDIKWSDEEFIPKGIRCHSFTTQMEHI